MIQGDNRPIGVFDSGIGGLTVVHELIATLPHESIMYFGDTARVPYGPKSPPTVQRYTAESTAYLLSQDVKMVVIACNTATAYGYEAAKATLGVPVIGVIEPGARAAVEATRTGRIGVIGTAGTIASGAYDLAVRRKLADARVYGQPCPLFVPLVEEGWLEGSATRTIAESYLRHLREVEVDVVILGCTHYPLLSTLLEDIMGPKVQLVDSARETARDVQRILSEENLAADPHAQPTYRFIASDSPIRFRDVGRRFLGDLIGDVERVDVEGCRFPTDASTSAPAVPVAGS
jgi:glutamate racemase